MRTQVDRETLGGSTTMKSSSDGRQTKWAHLGRQGRGVGGGGVA